MSHSSWSAASAASVIRAGPQKCSPPCTIRCATASIRTVTPARPPTRRRISSLAASPAVDAPTGSPSSAAGPECNAAAAPPASAASLSSSAAEIAVPPEASGGSPRSPASDSSTVISDARRKLAGSRLSPADEAVGTPPSGDLPCGAAATAGVGTPCRPSVAADFPVPAPDGTPAGTSRDPAVPTRSTSPAARISSDSATGPCPSSRNSVYLRLELPAFRTSRFTSSPCHTALRPEARETDCLPGQTGPPQSGRSIRPYPVPNLRHVVANLTDIPAMLRPAVLHLLLERCGQITEPGHPVDHIHNQVESVHVVQDTHIERRCRSPLLLVAAYVQVVVVGAPVRKPVNQPGITVVRKQDGPRRGEQDIEIRVRESMRMLG